ncbi:MAG: protein kinase [Planctomycetota bacterium]
MIASDDGLDTALARLLHVRGALDLGTLRGVLLEVRAARGLSGVTLAQVLHERGLVAPDQLEDALQTLGGARAAAATQAALPPAPPGFRIVAELARGGMGAVYEVEHESGARFALKTLLPGGLGLEGGEADVERRRFQREAEALAKLDHPHVVRVHAADFEGRVPWMVQDLLPGGTLEARLKDGPLPTGEAVTLATKLALGVAHAHGHGILHRDLKPLNVLFDDRGEPRLVDFGLARALAGSSLTQSGVVLGTPSYMAPEQALGEPVDERTDVYGLGAVLYALLTGRPPFSGSGLGVMAEVVEDPPTPPRELVPDVPEWLEAVCLRALAKRREERFPDAESFAGALRRRDEGPPSGRRPALGVLGALALALVALGLGAALHPRGRAEREALRAEVRQGLRGATWGELAAARPGWEERGAPRELTLVQGLLAVAAGDRAAAERARAALEAPGAPDALAGALTGALAALDSDVSPGPAAAALHAARAELGLSCCAGLEAELLVRAGDPAGALAALAADRKLKDPAPLDERARRALRAALYAIPAPPASQLVARFPAADVAVIDSGRETLLALDRGHPVAALAQLPPDGLPRFLAPSPGQAARWVASASALLGRGLSAPAAHYGLAAWLEVGARLGLDEAFARVRAQAGPALVATIDVTRLGDHEGQSRLQPAQLALFGALLPRDPRGPLLLPAIQLGLLGEREVRRGFADLLRRVADAGRPTVEEPWLLVLGDAMELSAAQPLWPVNPRVGEIAEGLESMRVRLRPPPPLPRGWEGIQCTRLDAIILHSLGRCYHFQRDFPRAAARYGALEALGRSVWTSLPPWRHFYVQARREVLDVGPRTPETARQRRALALEALLAIRDTSPGDGFVEYVDEAWTMEGALEPAERAALLRVLRDHGRQYWPWGLRVVALELREPAPDRARLAAEARRTIPGLEADGWRGLARRVEQLASDITGGTADVKVALQLARDVCQRDWLNGEPLARARGQR